ncbi:hypothetical protein D3C76_465350 [compost metagenome]
MSILLLVGLRVYREEDARMHLRFVQANAVQNNWTNLNGIAKLTAVAFASRLCVQKKMDIYGTPKKVS